MEIIITLIIQATSEQTMGKVKDYIVDAVVNYGALVNWRPYPTGPSDFFKGVEVKAISAARPEVMLIEKKGV